MLGIFDSGIGGLTVAKAIANQYPNAAFIYLGDTARAPYGDKSAKVIFEYAKQDIEFLLAQGATDIVIACNTVSAVCLEELRQAFPKINFYDVISPVVKQVASRAPASIGIIGTRATIRAGAYQQQLAQVLPQADIRAKACPLFVPLIENDLLEHDALHNAIPFYLQEFKDRPTDILILGCTHYPLIENQIRKFIGDHTKIIGSPHAVALALPPSVFINSTIHKHQFFFSDTTPLVHEVVGKWFGGATPQGIKL